MAASRQKMICPSCGAEMNHHCDKLMYGMDAQPGARVEAGTGGVITEFHACPECGGGALRPA